MDTWAYIYNNELSWFPINLVVPIDTSELIPTVRLAAWSAPASYHNTNKLASSGMKQPSAIRSECHMIVGLPLHPLCTAPILAKTGRLISSRDGNAWKINNFGCYTVLATLCKTRLVEWDLRHVSLIFHDTTSPSVILRSTIMYNVMASWYHFSYTLWRNSLAHKWFHWENESAGSFAQSFANLSTEAVSTRTEPHSHLSTDPWLPLRDNLSCYLRDSTLSQSVTRGEDQELSPSNAKKRAAESSILLRKQHRLSFSASQTLDYPQLVTQEIHRERFPSLTIISMKMINDTI